VFQFLDGGNDNDSLLGSAADETLQGGAGNDTLNGGGGNDWVTYSDSPDPVTIDLGNGTASAIDGNDILSGIEAAEGGRGDDSILGDSLARCSTAGLAMTGWMALMAMIGEATAVAVDAVMVDLENGSRAAGMAKMFRAGLKLPKAAKVMTACLAMEMTIHWRVVGLQYAGWRRGR
jgi:hypothetical protein